MRKRKFTIVILVAVGILLVASFLLQRKASQNRENPQAVDAQPSSDGGTGGVDRDSSVGSSQAVKTVIVNDYDDKLLREIELLAPSSFDKFENGLLKIFEKNDEFNAGSVFDEVGEESETGVYLGKKIALVISIAQDDPTLLDQIFFSAVSGGESSDKVTLLAFLAASELGVLTWKADFVTPQKIRTLVDGENLFNQLIAIGILKNALLDEYSKETDLGRQYEGKLLELVKSSLWLNHGTIQEDLRVIDLRSKR